MKKQTNRFLLFSLFILASIILFLIVSAAIRCLDYLFNKGSFIEGIEISSAITVYSYGVYVTTLIISALVGFLRSKREFYSEGINGFRFSLIYSILVFIFYLYVFFIP